jgi:hypothetical protein
MSVLIQHPGFVANAAIWNEYLRLGFSKRVSLDQNGGRHRYARTMAYLPDPSRRSVPLTLARLFVAIHARLSGETLPNKGWTVCYKNGDHLDLRIENLAVVPSRGHRNSFYASWTVNARWHIVEAGGDPKAVFAAKRRAFRAIHEAAIKRDPQPPVPPPPRPRKKARRGRP